MDRPVACPKCFVAAGYPVGMKSAGPDTVTLAMKCGRCGHKWTRTGPARRQVI